MMPETGAPHVTFEVPAVSLDSDAGFRALVELSPDAVFIIANGYHIFANSRGLALLGGRTIQDLQTRPSLDFMHRDSRGDADERMHMMVDERKPLGYVEEKIVRLDGAVIDIEAAGTPIVVHGQAAALVVVRDITARKQAQAAVRSAEARLQAAFRHAATPMLIVDARGRVLAANPALARLVRRDLGDMIHEQCWQIVHPEDLPVVQQSWAKLINGATRSIDGEFRYLRVDGRRGWVYACAAALGDDEEFIIHLTDITDARRARKRLAQRATQDSLTGLPNRYVILDQLSPRRPYADRFLTDRSDWRATDVGETDESAALLFLDLDGFKQINDQYGHQVGDVILGVVATRLRQAVPDTDTVGRLGGDEFAVVVRGRDSAVRAEEVARRILAMLAEPISVGGVTVVIGASIGIATTPDLSARPAQTLLSEADAAMYEAKTRTRGGVGHDVDATSEE